MSHLYINPTMHHITTHWSIFIYASYINDNSLILLHLCIIYQWKLIDPYSSMHHLSMTNHWSIYAWHHMHHMLDIYLISSRTIHITFDINHQSINPLASINHLTSINQTIGINDNMILQKYIRKRLSRNNYMLHLYVTN